MIHVRKILLGRHRDEKKINVQCISGMNRITSLSDDNGTRFSPQPTKNRTCCCVDGCYSKACKDFTVRFHSFPKPDFDFVDVSINTGRLEKVCRREVWKRRLRIDKMITENMRVCSLHFKKNDYILPGERIQLFTIHKISAASM